MDALDALSEILTPWDNRHSRHEIQRLLPQNTTHQEYLHTVD
jgi:hypothetical protein